MTRPRLSLLIPAFNAARFLPRLIASARAQTEPFDEIWVYDDCSTDDTAKTAEALGAKVLRGDVNKGCSAGKNALASVVSTEWMHFHDADDALLPNFVRLARKWIEKDSADVVLFDYETRDDATDELLETIRFDGSAMEADARRYATARQINPFCGLYRRDAFLTAGGYDENPLILYNEDTAFHIRMAFAGLRFSGESEVSIINYRVKGSMSAGNAKRCSIAQFHVMSQTLQRPGAERYTREISDNLWQTSGVLASLDAWKEAGAAARLAASLHPPSARNGGRWFKLLASINPEAAIRLRENAIRRFKPGLRAGGL